ncbi:tyrosine-type recombinase/integrase [Bradyrhizobium sp. GCM10027634]|uniref:tyrosine-type recombinase/integrase n=1 Tax=unclassified Bradyrhizobium TaxID=2631580 RepID=UPI00188C8DAC|nr:MULTISPECIES: site-specific integrase [unclassified Bradyrhizobium]MDN5003911.1 site-specific integrase [Bradyrhizobium sp. WYCCWR 12677]QOZ45428.1 hypothetical protein XH89_19520 [Bradyrhizobium sp. CCBAU 53340]
MKFTKDSLNKLKAEREKAGNPERVYWDDETPGFGLRFRAGSTSGSFIAHFRIGDKQRKMTIDKQGKISVDDARERAREYFQQAKKNIDPAVQLRKDKKRASKALEPLIQPFLDYLEHDRKRSPSYVGENKRSLERYFAALHTFAPDDIDREMVSTELRNIKTGHGPIAMNRSRAHLSKFFNWMIAEGAASHNPVTGTNKTDEHERDRVLTFAELANIWNACDGGEQSDKIIRLLMLTAMRRDQITKLRWSEVNFEEERIELPAKQGRTKNKEKFLMPLSKPALAILKTMKARENIPFVFGEGEKGFSGHSNAKERVDAIMKERGTTVPNWTYHDFRTAFQTHAQDALKVPFHVADLLLSHKGSAVRKGAAKHYNFAQYLDEKVDAMSKWGRFIESLSKSPKPDLRLVA